MKFHIIAALSAFLALTTIGTEAHADSHHGCTYGHVDNEKGVGAVYVANGDDAGMIIVTHGVHKWARFGKVNDLHLMAFTPETEISHTVSGQLVIDLTTPGRTESFFYFNIHELRDFLRKPAYFYTMIPQHYLATQSDVEILNPEISAEVQTQLLQVIECSLSKGRQ